MAASGFSLFSDQVPNAELQRQTVESFWPQSRSTIDNYEPYFKHLRHLIAICCYPAGYRIREKFACKTYEDLGVVVKCLNKHRGESRREIANTVLSDHFPHSDIIRVLRSIELAATCWLSLNIRSSDSACGTAVPRSTVLVWPDGMSLVALANEPFPNRIPSLETYGPSIRRGFTAVNLTGTCGIRLEWTLNLADHLLYDASRKKVHIYPHKIFLLSHLESCDIFPKALLEETLKTLDLLFPSDKKTQNLLLDEKQPFFRTHNPGSPRATDFGDFAYWRHRLVVLHDAFTEPPTSFHQMWYDRRNPMQWWTFWLAAIITLLTAVFGIISSYASLRQTTLAEQSYELALLQACNQNDLVTRLCRR